MNIKYKSRNLEITEAMKEYREKRLNKIDKHIGPETAVVTMSSIRDRQRLEVTIPYHGMVIRGEDEGYDIYTCIDKVSEKIETQIHKYRQRLIKRGRGVSRDYVASMPEEHWVEDDKPVRTKTFTTKPMNLEEAIMQMNLLGHSFFVFVNDETNDVNVIYRRKDGDYGLLAPEI